jgi:hypothetical protein
MSDTPDLSPEPYTLDFLMSMDPCELTMQDLDMLIQYHRNIRADRASGARTKKVSTAAAPGGVQALLKAKKPVVTGIARRGL